MMDYLAERGSFKSACEDEEEEEELGFVRFSRGLGRKRIGFSIAAEASPSNREFDAPLKRRRRLKFLPDFDKSYLESLPQDVLIRMLCFVDHDDLKQLFLVSKTIREASLIAKQLHFAYTTPRKVPAFRNSLDLEGFTDMEPPDAPMRQYKKPAIRKNLPHVATVLFSEAEI